jgi:uroporphyrinogen decarboxylase
VDDTHVRDIYGVLWDRTVDKDIGTPCDWPIRTPADLDRYEWPDPDDDAWYAGMAEGVKAACDRFTRYCLGFSLYERAWTLRGMSELLIDMIERPLFVEEFLDRIVEHNLVQVRRALACGVDAVYFGDDYGMQTGLIMGHRHWRRFFKPRLARMFAPVREARKFVCMHSCGCVAELFDDLVQIGLNLFNPFQPEVMDVFALKKRYHGRLAFHGGMSIQKVLPFGTVEQVREMTQRLIDAGRDGGYVFSPSHAVPPDVPPANLVAMMDVLRSQPGYVGP